MKLTWTQVSFMSYIQSHKHFYDIKSVGKALKKLI